MNLLLASVEHTDAVTPNRGSTVASAVSFLLIGGGAALGFVLLSNLAMWLLPPLPRWLVSAACYAAFIVPVYLLHRRFSFRATTPHVHALPRYVATQTGALLLAAVFSFVAYGVFGLPSLAASVAVVVATSGVNFVILRSWAFAHPRRA